MRTSEIKTQTVAVSAITVADRIRKENGDIDALATSIRERGLINPITLMEQTSGGYVLIAGLRRLNAVRALGETEIRATVLSPMDADETLMLEIAENEQRKEFTVSERLVYAERIKAVEVEKSRQRMSDAKKNGGLEGVANRPPLELGKTRDIVAKKAGFSSQQQMRRAATVADKRPDLLEEIDKKAMTISGAYEKAMTDTELPSKPTSPKTPPLIEERRIEIAPLLPFNPLTVQVPTEKSGVESARHDQLMNNPVYRQLFEHDQEAVQQANLARGELRARCEAYERRIRAYEENAEAMRGELARLKEAQCAGT